VSVGCPEKSQDLAESLKEGLALLDRERDVIYLLSDDLPLVSPQWAVAMQSALAEENEGVVMAVGEQPRYSMGLYRRGVLEHLADFLKTNPEQPLERVLAEKRITFLPAENLASSQSMAMVSVDSVEGYLEALSALEMIDPSHPAITVELYGNLRIQTGCDLLPMRCERLGGICDILRRVYPAQDRLIPDAESLAAHFRFSINGKTVSTNPDLVLSAGDHVILFSATVGG